VTTKTKFTDLGQHYQKL